MRYLAAVRFRDLAYSPPRDRLPRRVLVQVGRAQGPRRGRLGPREGVRGGRQGVPGAHRDHAGVRRSARAGCSRSRSSRARRSSCSPPRTSDFVEQGRRRPAGATRRRSRLYARGRIVVWTRARRGRAGQARRPRRRQATSRSRSRTPSTRRTAAPRSRRSRRPACGSRSRTAIVLGENIQATMLYARDGNVDVAIVALSLAVVDRRRRLPRRSIRACTIRSTSSSWCAAPARRPTPRASSPSSSPRARAARS